MGRIILGLLVSLLVACSLSARANAQDFPMDLLLRSPLPTVTMKKYPSICWILARRRVGATMMFTLRDSRSIKPVLEVQLPNSIQTETNETCDCVNLKDYDILLEPDILYHWQLLIAHNPAVNVADVVIEGRIDRCSEEDCLIREMPSRCDRNFVLDLASQGFYYDSLSCLCDLVKSNPDDKTLRRMQAALMRKAGFILSPN